MAWSDYGINSVDDFDGFRLKNIRTVLAAFKHALVERSADVVMASGSYKTNFELLISTKMDRLSSSVVGFDCLGIDCGIDAIMPLFFNDSDWTAWNDPFGGTDNKWTEASMLTAIGASERIRLSDQTKNFVDGLKQAYQIINRLRVSDIYGATQTIYLKKRNGAYSSAPDIHTAASLAKADCNSKAFTVSGPYSNWTQALVTGLSHTLRLDKSSTAAYVNRHQGHSLSLSGLSAKPRIVIVAARTGYPKYLGGMMGGMPYNHEDNDFGLSLGQLQRWITDEDFSEDITRSYGAFGAPSDLCTVTSTSYDDESFLAIGWGTGYDVAQGFINYYEQPVYLMQARQYEYQDYLT